MFKKKILILGASGMLGHVLMDRMFSRKNFEVRGTIRSIDSVTESFYEKYKNRLYHGIDINDIKCIQEIFKNYKPEIVINAIGVIKQLDSAHNPLICIHNNALFPHILYDTLDKILGSTAQMIHISTDCVFDGIRGYYRESDNPAPIDLYGRSKLLGEVTDKPNCVTLRTSIIGHELKTSNSLIDWFLNQTGKTIKGYSEAIYTGFTVYEFENIISNYVVGSDISGLYHVSSYGISKYDLLNIVNRIYSVNAEIDKDTKVKINRSLNSDRFKDKFNYFWPTWENMIQDMFNYRSNCNFYLDNERKF